MVQVPLTGTTGKWDVVLTGLEPLESRSRRGMVVAMAMSEAERSDLYTWTHCEVLGTKRAELLVKSIPIHDLDELTTKGDTARVETELKGSIAAGRAELKADIAALRTELKGDIAGLETRMAELETRVMATINAESAALRKSFTNWMLTLLVAIIGAMGGVGLLT